MPMASSLPIGGRGKLKTAPSGSFQIVGGSTGLGTGSTPLAVGSRAVVGSTSTLTPANATSSPSKRWMTDSTPYASTSVALDGLMVWPPTPTPMGISESNRGLNFSSILAPTNEAMSAEEYNAKMNAEYNTIPEASDRGNAVPLPFMPQLGQQVFQSAFADTDVVPKVRVKNTFIDDFDGEDMDDIMLASHELGVKSLPVHLLRGLRSAAPTTPSPLPSPTAAPYTQAATSAVLNQSTFQPSSPVYGMPMMIPQSQNLLQGQMRPVTMVGTQVNTSQATSPSYITTQTMAATSPVVTPYASRQPQPSEGSVLHGIGQCRPCAWYWKPQGCANGNNCRHCHLCPEGELKNRKKDKVATLRSGPRP
jgi:hypothetical protein